MARYTGAVCRQCRREGQKLFLKGERCYSEKCSVGIRAYAPGQHGQGRKKSSEYGLQLRAKQTARRFYGVQENQFHHYFEIAERKPGITGDNLLRILESRLDNVVYRVGFASSRAEARQLVGHGHYEVDGKRYHHIIDPDTMMPSEFFDSVTVITPDSTMADALSTSFFTISLEEGHQLLNQLKSNGLEIDVIWVSKEPLEALDGLESTTSHGYNIVYSDSLSEYIVK